MNLDLLLSKEGWIPAAVFLMFLKMVLIDFLKPILQPVAEKWIPYYQKKKVQKKEPEHWSLVIKSLVNLIEKKDVIPLSRIVEKTADMDKTLTLVKEVTNRTHSRIGELKSDVYGIKDETTKCMKDNKYSIVAFLEKKHEMWDRKFEMMNEKLNKCTK